MCGVSLGSRGAAFRRATSSTNLHELHACCAEGIKSSKSAADLTALLHSSVVAELASLRFGNQSAAQSSGDDTARGSPTSGYEQLLRSRSPSAVLFGSEDGRSTSLKCETQHGSGAEQQEPSASSQQPPFSWCATSLPGDYPFLESAACFSIVHVGGNQMAEQALPELRTASGLSHSGAIAHLAAPFAPAAEEPAASSPAVPEPDSYLYGSTIPARHPSVTLAVNCTTERPPAAERATSASGVTSHFPSPSSSPFTAFLSSPASPAPSPFARLSLQDHPSCISHSPPIRAGSLAAEMREAGSAGSLSRRGSSSFSVDASTRHSAHLSEGHAAEELFYRLNHARQTVDFVKRQAQSFSALDKAAMSVWEALELLNTLREYESALLGDADATPDMPLLEHALQCAEACRAAFPDEDFMHLAGLLAPLGKLLAHAKFGAEPQFAICGETFPVGCRFHPAVAYSQYFSANPDRRKRLYNSPLGLYRHGCGLGAVLMSWGAGEYLHMVLRLNGARLPPEALFCLRHQALRCVFRPGAPYSELLSEFDRVQLSRLTKFQELCRYRRLPRAQPLLVPAEGEGGTASAIRVAPELKAYYDRLLAKYLPQEVLLW